MAYRKKGCSLYYRFITSILGVLIAICAGLAFTVVFKNYHCAIWGLFSGVCALISLIMHIRVYRDIAYSIQPVTFERLKYIGVLGMVVGVVVFIAYCIKGLLSRETGIKVNGWFIVTVWGYMTWKSGFLLTWYARKYRRELMEELKSLLDVSGAVNG